MSNIEHTRETAEGKKPDSIIQYIVECFQNGHAEKLGIFLQSILDMSVPELAIQAAAEGISQGCVWAEENRPFILSTTLPEVLERHRPEWTNCIKPEWLQKGCARARQAAIDYILGRTVFAVLETKEPSLVDCLEFDWISKAHAWLFGMKGTCHDIAKPLALTLQTKQGSAAAVALGIQEGFSQLLKLYYEHDTGVTHISFYLDQEFAKKIRIIRGTENPELLSAITPHIPEIIRLFHNISKGKDQQQIAVAKDILDLFKSYPEWRTKVDECLDDLSKRYIPNYTEELHQLYKGATSPSAP